MKLSLVLLALFWSPYAECQLRGNLRKLQTEEEEVQTIADKVKEQVESYVEAGSVELPEIDLSGVAGVTGSVLEQIKSAVGEENMTEEKVQEQADKIADVIAAKYIETEATEEGASATTSFDVSGITDAISSIEIAIELDLEKTSSPTSSPTDSPTASPTDSPTSSPTDSPTSSPSTSPTESPTESPTSSPTDSPTASPTDSPTASPTASPTSSPTASPTSSPTSSPTVTPALLAGIVDKAMSFVDNYTDNTEVTLPEVDAERISGIAETVFAQIQKDAEGEAITEEYLQSNKDKISQLIAMDFLELELTEDGEPLDLSDENLTELISEISTITLSMALESEGN